jgi:hypothetical protein
MSKVTESEKQLASEIAVILRCVELDEQIALSDVAAELGVPHDGDGGVFRRAFNRCMLQLSVEENIFFRSIGHGGIYRRGNWKDAVINAKRTRKRALRGSARALMRVPALEAVPDDKKEQVQRLAEKHSSMVAHHKLQLGRSEVYEKQLVNVPDLGSARRPDATSEEEDL